MPGIASAIPNSLNAGNRYASRLRKRPTVFNADGTPYKPLTPANASMQGVTVPTLGGMTGPRMMPAVGATGVPSLDGGGRSFARYGEDDGMRIDAHPYGDTFADVPRSFEGLDAGLYAKNRENPVLQAMRPANLGALPPPPGSGLGRIGAGMGKIPFRAHGGPVAPGQPFIAGDDPKGNGKENREMIIPMPDGSTHVMPMKGKPHKGMPMMGKGTVKLVDDHGKTDAFGRVAMGPDVLEAFDTEGQLLGHSTGLPPRQPVAAPAPFVPSPAWQAEQAQQAQAMERARNPEGITVGVTPRAPLTGFADADALRGGPQSREDRAYARMERDVLRQARGNPRLELALLGGKAQAEQDAAEAQAAQIRNVFNQGETTKRTEMTVAGANQRAAARLGVDMNFKLAEEGRRQAEFAQSLTPPAISTVGIPGTDYVVPFAGTRAMGTLPTNAPKGMAETATGSGIYRNLDIPNSGDFTMAPSETLQVGGGSIGPFQLPGASAAMPPQFKPIPAKPPLQPKAPTIKNFDTTGLKPDWRQWDAEKGGWVKANLIDENKDGIPDVQQAPGAAVAAPITTATAKKPSSAFVNSVQN